MAGSNNQTDDWQDVTEDDWQDVDNTPAVEPINRPIEAGLQGFANRLTSGHAAQLQAMAEPITDRVFNMFSDQQVEPAELKGMVGLGKDYVEARDSNLQRQEDLYKENPKSYGLGAVLGTVNQAGLMGAAMPTAAGAGMAGRAAQAAKVGAFSGVSENPGDIEGELDPLQVGARLKGGAIGAGFGLAGQGVSEGVSAVSPKVAQYFRQKASEKAYRALGPTKKAMEKAKSMGADQSVGRTLLDEGAVPVFGTPGRISGRLEDLKNSAGKRVGELVKSTGDQKLIDTQAIALSLMDDPSIAGMRNVPGMEGVADGVEKALETFASNGDMTLEGAQALRQSIDKSINFNKSLPEQRGKAAALYKIRNAIRDRMDEAIAEAGGSAPGELKSANRKYGNLVGASDIVENKIAGDATNRTISLTDTIAAMGGMTAGGLPAAAALGTLNKAGRSFGSAMQARGFDAAGKGAERAAVMSNIAKKSSSVPAAVASSMGKNGDFSSPINQETADFYKENPEMLDKIKSEKVKKAIKRRIRGN